MEQLNDLYINPNPGTAQSLRDRLLAEGHQFYPPNYGFYIRKGNGGGKPWARKILVVPTPGTCLVLNFTTGAPPTVEHRNWNAAQAEADRLATENPMHVFAVVEVKTANNVVLTDGRKGNIDKFKMMQVPVTMQKLIDEKEKSRHDNQG